MYRGKRSKSTKHIWLLASVVLLVSIAVTGTVAYLFTHTEAVTNTFTLAEVPISVVEDPFDGETKKNVCVQNEGDVDAYIRATVIANWVDDEGNIYGEKPVEGIDYELYPDSISQTIGYNTTEWAKIGDYYYYKGKVAPDGETGILFTNCKVKEGVTPPEGYTLSVEILAQSIQADGVDSNNKTPVELAWGEAAANAVGAIPQP